MSAFGHAYIEQAIDDISAADIRVDALVARVDNHFN
ncbi:hypothetical protein Rleg10DRAFT_3584 [Rhizobium leguminosarum bv. trifolii WSM2012]|nr:hypothetical protein Rleg10DRAFT_3584 [Rhizobium leguminosarum bv. trifolii WSM2012]